MGKNTGFIEFERTDEKNKAVKERLGNYKEFTVPFLRKSLKNKDQDVWIVAYLFAIAAARSGI